MINFLASTFNWLHILLQKSTLLRIFTIIAKDFNSSEAYSAIGESTRIIFCPQCTGKVKTKRFKTTFNIYMKSGPTSVDKFGISELAGGICRVDHTLNISSSAIRIALNEIFLSLSSLYLSQQSTFASSAAYRSFPIH